MSQTDSQRTLLESVPAKSAWCRILQNPARVASMCSMLILTPVVALAVEEPDQQSATAVSRLEEYLRSSPANRKPLADTTFAKQPLSRADADTAADLLWKDRADAIRESRRKEMEERQIELGDHRMPFYYRVFGEAAKHGRSLYISMHGGGGTTARINDAQWENQKRLYEPKEGIYLAPRAPTNAWNLWHQSHIDLMFDRLIENMIVFENVDPNRIYLMGYSAGGDGVFQLAPRMADRFAAAAMMAGHPNETSALGLRNLPFTIHMGGRDSAYDRNRIAKDWALQLEKLQRGDVAGYTHLVKIYPEKGHWMDRKDASAIPWMAEFQRRTAPDRIVWKQDDVTHNRFYWLAVSGNDVKPRSTVVASREKQRVDVESDTVTQIRVRLNDELADLDAPVQITSRGMTLFDGQVIRTVAMMATSLEERADPKQIYCSEVIVKPIGQDVP